MAQIADSGQCFRVTNISPADWEIIVCNKVLKIHQEDDSIFAIECTREEYEKIWFDYFDMNRDYGLLKKKIISTNDLYLISAVDYGYGIRILKQNLWEMIVTFLISQQNNIPRIKKIIANLCTPFKIKFPTPYDLEKYTEKDFLSFGLGYRSVYLQNIVKSVIKGDLDLNKLKMMETAQAVKFLQSFHGIGVKVANCIALYGLHRVESFPIDIWIKNIIKKRYNNSFDISKFEGYAGIVQQYMYFYERNNPDI